MLGRTVTRSRDRMYCRTIRTVRDISRDDRARIAPKPNDVSNVNKQVARCIVGAIGGKVTSFPLLLISSAIVLPSSVVDFL